MKIKRTRGRGPGVRGPGVRGHGVWETRGLVENAGSGGKHEFHYFSLKYELSSLKWKAKILLAKLRWISIQHPSAWNAFLDQENKLNISWENHLRAFQSVVHWFSFGDPLCSVYFIFHSNLRVFFTFEKERWMCKQPALVRKPFSFWKNPTRIWFEPWDFSAFRH